MKTKITLKLSFLLLLLNTSVFINSYSQTIPLVYDKENTGDSFPKPVKHTLNELPIIAPLPDPFMWADSTSRSTNFSDWRQRRAQLAEQFSQYEIGPKPPRPDTLTASYTGGVLTVNITVNGHSMTMTATVTLPSGSGPFPAVIGVGFGSGSLPSTIFSGNNIATIAYNINQVSTYGSKNTSDPYFKLYPALLYSGQYAPWAWGVSRLIDGLELTQDSLPIDLKHLAVTGCSYAGKLALFAGALDERVALTIAQESGGGGAAAWRVSNFLPGVETLSATSNLWFMNEMFQFGNANTPKLPEDHHELMAIVAPRALFVLGNPSYQWLADESGYVSCRAAQKVYETFGIGDRFGFSIVGGHNHCQLPASETPEVTAFVKRFLLGDTTVNTDIHTNPYPATDYERWTYWWGKDTAAFPPRDINGTESIWLEAECGTVGKDWKITPSSSYSNKYFVSFKTGIDTSAGAPTDSAFAIYFPINVTQDTTFNVFASAYSPSKSDAFWIKLDDGAFEHATGMSTGSLVWANLKSYQLSPGAHTIAIASLKPSIRLDELCISSNSSTPMGKGDTAENVCVPVIITGINSSKAITGYALGQNYPNPFSGKTSISFNIPENTYVSLKVYNMLGVEMVELAGKIYSQGNHVIEYDSRNLPKGMYFYTIRTDRYTANQSMIIQ